MPRSLHPLTLLKLATLAAALAACGGIDSEPETANKSDSGAPPSQSDVSPAAEPDAAEQAGVSAVAFCNTLYGVGDCIASDSAAAASCTGLASALASGRVAYDAAKAASCTRQLGAASANSCSGWMPTACDGVITGTTPVGGVCYTETDCAGTANCVFPPAHNACSGVCTAGIPANGSCASGGECARGYECTDEGSGARCAPTSPLLYDPPTTSGHDCGFPVASTRYTGCVVGLVCDQVTQKCTERVAVGGSCEPGHAVCSVGSACSPATHVCTAFPTVAGASCGLSMGEDYVGCAGDTSCDAEALDRATGTCRVLVAAGASCIAPSECSSGNCSSDGVTPGVCAAAACPQI